jgi:hypothetical protein
MKKCIPILLVLTVGIIISFPFFHQGYFPTHDGQWAIVRLTEMNREIKDLQIPPRWSDYLNHGYGYPLFHFTYPFPYYAGLLIKLAGFSYTDSIKAVFILSVLLSGIFMFLLAKQIGGIYSGIIASLLYLVSPFRFVNLYIRGSIGESLCLALFPIIFYFTVKFIIKPTLLKLIAISVSLAVLILSHNITAIIFLPFYIFFFFTIVSTYFEDMKKYTIKYFLPTMLLSLGLSAFFFIPALIEKKYILLSAVKLTDINEHFIKLSDFLFSEWSFGIKPSFQLGWAHILVFILSIFSVFTAGQIEMKKHLKLFVFIIFSFLVLVIFTNKISIIFWRMAPLSWIDFPWRLLTPLTFFVAFSSVFLSLHRWTRIVGIILVVFTVIFGSAFANPEFYLNQPDEYYMTNDATTTSKDELMPLWVKDFPKNRYINKVEIAAGHATVSNVIYNSKSIKFDIDSGGESSVNVNTIYFPGWEFYINNLKQEIRYDNSSGLISLSVPPGKQMIIGKLSDTPVRKLSNLITLFCFLIVAICLMRYLFVTILNKRR